MDAIDGVEAVGATEGTSAAAVAGGDEAAADEAAAAKAGAANDNGAEADGVDTKNAEAGAPAKAGDMGEASADEADDEAGD